MQTGDGTAPVGQVVDAFMMAPHIDSTIYVVRYNYTLKSQISIIDKIYKERKLNHPMVVLNDVKKEIGYGYGYGEDYINNGNKKSKLISIKSKVGDKIK